MIAEGVCSRRTTVIVVSLAASFPVLFLLLRLLSFLRQPMYQVNYFEKPDPIMLVLSIVWSRLVMMMGGFAFLFDTERFSRITGRMLLGSAIAWVLFVTYYCMVELGGNL
jgi:hypothetical protein